MVGTTVLQLAQIAILARLLDPTEFGLMAMVLTVIGFGLAFADMGISNVIIARHIGSRDVLATLYWANVLGGVVLAGVVLAATPAIAAFYGEPGLTSLLPWVALVFVASAAGQQFQVLLQQELAFSVLAKIEVGAVAVGTGIAIWAGFAGAGALSLVLGYTATAVLKAMALAAVGWSRWRPGMRLRLTELREHLGFGAYQMGERGLGYVSQDLDYILIGRIAGAEPLGAYMLAYQLVITPMRKLVPVLTRVAFPLFARSSADDARLGRGYGEVLKLVALAIFPVLVLLAALGPQLVPALFGGGWEQAVTLLPPLAIVAAVKTVGSPAGPLFLAKNRPELGFRLQLLLILALAAVILATIQIGVVAVAWAYAALVLAVFAVTWAVINALVGFSLAYQARVLWPGIASAAAALVAVLAVRIPLAAVISPVTVVAIAAALGLAAAGLTAWRLDGRYIREQLRLVLSGLPGGRRAPADEPLGVA